MPIPNSSLSAHEHLTFLSGSPERLKLLVELQQRALSSAELETHTEISYETIQRLLEAGIERDWIAEQIESECYALTAAGDLVLQAYFDAEPLDRDLLTFLVTSMTRLRVLEELRGDSLSAVELNEHISVTHPTVYRALHSLEEWGLLDWQQDPELTPTGMDTYEAYRLLADTIAWITNYATVLNQLGDIARTLPAQALARGSEELVVNSMAHPDAVLDHFEARISDRSSERIQAVLPSMCAFVDRIRRLLLEDGTEIEAIIDEAVLEVARTSYPRVLDSVTDAESAELLVHPEKLQFGLAILDDSVFVFAYTDQSLLACIETASDALGTWAVDVYQTHHRAASRWNS
jgi:predicted transcriptional regulator